MGVAPLLHRPHTRDMERGRRFTGWGEYPAHKLMMGLKPRAPYTGPSRCYPGACKQPAEGGVCGGDLTASLTEFGSTGVETSCATCWTGDRYDHGLTPGDLA